MNESKELVEFEKTLLSFFADNLLMCKQKYRDCTSKEELISFAKEMRTQYTTIDEIIEKHLKIYTDDLADFMLHIMEGDNK